MSLQHPDVVGTDEWANAAWPIHAPDQERAEELLRRGISDHLAALPDGRQVMLKLSLPTRDDFYAGLITHPAVSRAVALSGGYSSVIQG